MLTDKENIDMLEEDIKWCLRDLDEAIADDCKRSIRELNVDLKDYRAELALAKGADPDSVEWGSPVADGIHSSDRRYMA